ncbi:MAG TPA: ABC transporter permease [Pedobacter sp.]
MNQNQQALYNPDNLTRSQSVLIDRDTSDADVNSLENYWNIVITPNDSVFNLRLKQVWNYRDLFWLLVRRDFVSFYKQTILGPLWFFLQPLFTILIYSYIFGSLAGISTEGVPRPLFYLAGITCWHYFAECLNKTSNVFTENAHVFGKVYFPRIIMPLSILFSNLIKFGIYLCILLVMIAWYVYRGEISGINSFAFLLPVLLALTAMLGAGLGMIVSSLTTRYRDLSFLVGFGVQLLMWASTVVYPLSAVPEKFRWLVSKNPMTPILETFRFGFLGAGTFSWRSLGLSALIICVIALVGVISFNKAERTSIDTV